MFYFGALTCVGFDVCCVCVFLCALCEAGGSASVDEQGSRVESGLQGPVDPPRLGDTPTPGGLHAGTVTPAVVVAVKARAAELRASVAAREKKELELLQFFQAQIAQHHRPQYHKGTHLSQDGEDSPRERTRRASAPSNSHWSALRPQLSLVRMLATPAPASLAAAAAADDAELSPVAGEGQGASAAAVATPSATVLAGMRSPRRHSAEPPRRRDRYRISQHAAKLKAKAALTPATPKAVVFPAASGTPVTPATPKAILFPAGTPAPVTPTLPEAIVFPAGAPAAPPHVPPSRTEAASGQALPTPTVPSPSSPHPFPAAAPSSQPPVTAASSSSPPPLLPEAKEDDE